MIRYVLLALLVTSTTAAQSTEDAPTAPGTENTSYGSIAFGWRTGSVVPSYTLDTGDNSVAAGTTILSAQLGTERWYVTGESTLSFDGFVDRHAIAIEYGISSGRLPMAIGIAYGYQSVSVPILQYEDLETRSQHRIQTVLGSLRTGHTLWGTTTFFAGPVGGIAHSTDSFDTYIGNELSASQQNAVLSGVAATVGLHAGVRWHWRSFSIDASVMPLWAPEHTRAILENDIILSGGIAYQTPWHVGAAVRVVRSQTSRGISHLGNSVTASITASYP